VDDVGVFKKLTETERTSISNRSLKLFTLSSIHQGTKSFLGKGRADDINLADKDLAVSYWEEISKHIPEWSLAASRKVATSELRKEFVHSHGLALHALGLVGFDLIRQHPKDWKKRLVSLQKVDWSRKNSKVWEGRALVSGRVSKASTNVQLTAIHLKRAIGLTLSTEDKKLEALVRASS
jgi:DNA sulfur modification protein DndB